MRANPPRHLFFHRPGLHKDAVFNTALPIFGLILAGYLTLAGYLAGWFEMFGTGATETLNRFAFIARPA